MKYNYNSVIISMSLYIYTTLFTLWKGLKFKAYLFEFKKIRCPLSVRDRVPHFTS